MKKVIVVKEKVLNDLGEKCLPKTALMLVVYYSFARRKNLSVNLSAKYSIMQKERDMWHSGGNQMKVDKEQWKTNDRIDGSLKRFLSLINSPFNSDITTKDLDKIADQLKDLDTKRNLRVTEGYNIFKKLFVKKNNLDNKIKDQINISIRNYDEEVDEEVLFWEFKSSPKLCKSWQKALGIKENIDYID